jgi:phosphatidylglycerol lysyltransferase
MKGIKELCFAMNHFINKRSLPFFRENGKLIAQYIFTLFFIGLGIWFLKEEKSEIHQVRLVLGQSRFFWVCAGVAVTFGYVLLQGLMYVASFRSIRCKIGLYDSVILFLKRNFVSVFLPAGGVSSLAFFTGEIEKRGISKSQIHFASSIYGFIGILSVILVAIPAFMFALLRGNVGSSEWIALLSVILLLTVCWYVYKSIVEKGKISKLLVRYFPAAEVFMDDLRANNIDRKNFLLTVFYSVLIEMAGIAHLLVAMTALGFEPSLLAAVMGYIISVIFLIVSPFLRGLGAIEVSMSWVLIRYGFHQVDAIAVTFLYRFFEFWLPLLLGVFSFLLKVNKLLMRIVPAILIFLLGIVNIVSALTPSIAERMNRLQEFLFMDAITASNHFVLMAGLLLLVTAAFLLKGLRNAWWFALVLSLASFAGHITKAIDYEEAIVALLVSASLLATHKEYNIRTNPRLRSVGIQTALLSIFAVVVYGVVGFYFLDKRHFNVDFSLLQSVRYCLQNYFIIGSSDLIPVSRFARDFLLSINISGALSMSFLVYTLIRPYVIKNNASDEDRKQAGQLVTQYGQSAIDYFKVYSDKMLYLPTSYPAFISYRVSGNYAVVLEDPVADSQEHKMRCVKEFDRYCFGCGLKTLYYRVSEESAKDYRAMGKKALFLGQEGVVDLSKFTLEGTARKSMRNALNKVSDRGFHANIHQPPLKDGLLQKLKSVSDEWLMETNRKEIIFSQGMFVWEELKQQTVITVENAEEKIVAFVNIIPDYAPHEGTYDLIRKTADAPNGIMDFILVELIKYFKQQGIAYLNLGFAPMSGLEAPVNFPEKGMKLAYEKIRTFSHYRGLRDFKEKFNPQWSNKYLIYDNDYDLLQVPVVLSNVIKA